MPILPGATYVFDLGYYDYAWWAELDQAGCRIVTRFKTNTPLLHARDSRPIRDRTCCRIASASCPLVKPKAEKIRCGSQCAKSSS